MKTTDLIEQSTNYSRIERAIQFLESNFQSQPGLDEIADSVALSKYHFHRLFKSYAGVTPAQFLHYLTVEYAKERLKESRSVFDASLAAGLSSAGRLHDLFVTYEAMTPGQYKKEGAGLDIHYGHHPTPFGNCLLATTERGICALRFIAGEKKKEAAVQLKREWPLANLVEAPAATELVVQRLFAAVQTDPERGFHLLLRGTNFQVKVWQALLAIPPGAMVSYQDIAAHVSTAAGARAAGNAIARNPIAYIIPCHRVISKAGKAHNYRWGASRKKLILGWEASRRHFEMGNVELGSQA